MADSCARRSKIKVLRQEEEQAGGAAGEDLHHLSGYNKRLVLATQSSKYTYTDVVVVKSYGAFFF